MMILLGGNIINFSRMHIEREEVWRKCSSQIKAMDSSLDGIAILDAEGRYTYVNAAHAWLYGYADKEDMIGLSWRNLYTVKRAAKFEAEAFPLLHRNGEWSGQSEGLRKDGSEFPQEVSLKLLEDGGLICGVRDLTEKIKNEKIMRIIKLAVEAATDGIAITDEENRILFMNRSFMKTHGYDPYEREKYINTDWRFLYNDVGQEQINSIVLPTTILKGAWSGSLSVMRKDGTLFYGDASLTRLADGLILGVMRDISERRRAEMEREELKEQLFQSQKTEAIGRLTNRLVTDFQAILVAVGKHAATLKRDSIADDERKICALEIVQEADKARELVEQLMAFSRTKTIKAGVVDLCETIVEAEQNFAQGIAQNIALMTDIKTDAAFTSSNSAQISQILKNLFLNSVEALEGHGGKIVLAVKDVDRNLFGLRRAMIVDAPPDKIKAIAVRMKTLNGKNYLMTGFLLKEKNYIQITVSDTGQGIHADILANIFDPFFTTKSLKKGTGLGLSTVQGTMVTNGGAVIVETAAGLGTSVHLFFPRYDTANAESPVLAA